jgi:flagellin
MLSLHTNISALSAQNSVSTAQKSLSTSMTRLSTGYRINSAMDDAAGLQIATRLNAQASGMAVAMRNTQNSISMMQTAEGAFNEVTNILSRMKDLATQAADASATANDQTAMQSEYDALGSELTNIMGNTSFGGSKLFNTGGGTLQAALKFQIGASSGETMTLNLTTQMTALGTALGAISTNFAGTGVQPGVVGTELTAAGSANTMIDKLSTAMDAVGTVRSALGAASNRLDHVYNNLSNISTNTKAASGRIMDVDYATESSNMTSQQMLTQASTAMLKQANGMSAMVMSLLQ